MVVLFLSYFLITGKVTCNPVFCLEKEVISAIVPRKSKELPTRELFPGLPFVWVAVYPVVRGLSQLVPAYTSPG
jgi:hypothetical protein